MFNTPQHKSNTPILSEITHNNQNYLFSAEMNISYMSNLAVLAYVLMFTQGFFHYIEREHTLIQHSITKNWLLLVAACCITAMFFIVARLIVCTSKAIIGEDGQKHYLPHKLEMHTFLKLLFVLSILFVFIVIQANVLFLSDGTADAIDYIQYFLMVAAYGFGLVGLFQARKLHQEYLNKQSF